MKCNIEYLVQYDLLNGMISINSNNVNKIIINNKEINIIDFFNNILKNEF